MFICVLGRQPELSLCELEARFTLSALKPLGGSIALVNVSQIDINRFGGLMKVGQVVAEEITDEAALMAACLDALPLSEGKVTVGLSWYGASRSSKQAFAFALELKKMAKKRKLNLRIVPNKQLELSTAQVLHNGLVKSGNAELLIVEAGGKYLLGRTVQVQDIEAYARRDYERPARDPKVGMLPPKLAQIMLNLAKVESGMRVLDPFCGTGVVLQEALLLGASAYGTDLEPRMVEFSQRNLQWLSEEFGVEAGKWTLQAGDARYMDWDEQFDAVVSELYLGPPLSREPAPQKLRNIAGEIDALLVDTLKNVARQSQAGVRLCLAVPAWQTKTGLVRLPSIDSLEEFGYNRVSFASASNQPLTYAREGQIVARELITLVRN